MYAQITFFVRLLGFEAVVLVVVGVFAPRAAHAHHLLRGAEAELGLEGFAAVLAFALQGEEEEEKKERNIIGWRKSSDTLSRHFSDSAHVFLRKTIRIFFYFKPVQMLWLMIFLLYMFLADEK